MGGYGLVISVGVSICGTPQARKKWMSFTSAVIPAMESCFHPIVYRRNGFCIVSQKLLNYALESDS